MRQSYTVPAAMRFPPLKSGGLIEALEAGQVLGRPGSFLR